MIKNRHKYYQPEIDGLRGISIILVIFYHLNINFFSGGFVGVDVFFVISGYLITNILTRDLKENKFSLINFFENRARRLIPLLYFIILSVTPFFFFSMSPEEILSYGNSLISVIFFISNIFFWKDSGYFSSASELKPFIHSWSLSIEEQYYLIYPIYLFVCYKFFVKYNFHVIIIFLIFSFFLCIFFSTSNQYLSFYLLPTRGWEILLGCSISIISNKHSWHYKFNLYLRNFFTVTGFLMIIISSILLSKKNIYPSYSTLIPTLGTVFIIIFISSKCLLYKILSNKLIIFIGLISYSLYVWHQPVLSLLKLANFEIETAIEKIFYLFFIFFLSIFTFYFVEKPFRNKKIINLKFFIIFFISFTIIIISFSAVTKYTNGFLFRHYDQIHLNIAKQFFNPGKYVESFFIKSQNKNFSNNDKRKKLVIVGDSLAQDLSNSINESELSTVYQISTFPIHFGCGNVIADTDLDLLRKKIDKPICNKNSKYNLSDGLNDKDLINKLNEAEEVWLSSSWSNWELKYINSTILFLKDNYNLKVKVFGTKYFGEISFNDYLNNYNMGNNRYILKQPKNFIEFNDKLANIISEEYFVNVSSLICKKNNFCQNVNNDNLLISYDGVHLTKAGAKTLGKLLYENLNF